MDWKQQLLDDSIAAIDTAVQQIIKKHDGAIKPPGKELQLGIWRSLELEYKNDKIDCYFSRSNYSRPDTEIKTVAIPADLTVQQVEDELLPLLKGRVQAYLQQIPDEHFLYFHFKATAIFQLKIQDAPQKKVTLFVATDEAKRMKQQRNTLDYIRKHIDNSPYPVKSSEVFFLVNNLLDPELFDAIDVAEVIRVFDQVIQRKTDNEDELRTNVHNITYALERWAKEQFLPRYCSAKKPQRNIRALLKKDVVLQPGDEPLCELLVYTAKMILKYEPDYSRSNGIDFLEIAHELGSKTATAILANGSGDYTPSEIWYEDDNVQCSAHDVFARFEIKIRKEHAAAYDKALDFICHLLSRGFPSSYNILFQSEQQHYLPVAELAHTSTHHFFANAVTYEALHPKLEQYARLAMKKHEWYKDVPDEEAEKNCMPGTYAVFGLAFYSADYFPLLQDYMQLVDDEHQSIQTAFTSVFLEKNSITPAIMPVIVSCLKACYDSEIFPVQQAMETPENLEAFITCVKGEEAYTVEHIAYFVWETKATMAKRIQQATGMVAKLLQEIYNLTER
ncbi:DUF6138 family protein [Chitinophagaceae bacterium MMS25-I14]